MTEEPKVDGLVEDGAVSPPASAVSDSPPAPIADVTALEARVSELTQELRGLQGRQDKSDNKYQESLDRYQSLLDQKLSPAEAKATMKKEDDDKSKDQMLEEIYEAVKSGKLGGVVGSEPEQTSEATRLIQEFGLDANSPEVNAVLGKGLEGMALENALLRLNKPKNAASAPPPKTPEPVRPPNEAALVEQYVKELSAVGNSRTAAAQVREKYEKLGVNTGGVSFN